MTPRNLTGLPPFCKTPKSLVRDPAISALAKALFALLDSHEGDRGIFPARQTLAEQMGCSTPTLDRALKELGEAGYLAVEPRRRRDGTRSSNSYRLLFPGYDGQPVVNIPFTNHHQRGLAQIQPVITGDEAMNETEIFNETEILERGAADAAAPRKGTVQRKDLTDEQREALCQEFSGLGNVLDRIAEALDHKAAGKRSDMYLYCRNWLRRDLEALQRRNGNGNGHRGPAGGAAQASASRTGGEHGPRDRGGAQHHDPLAELRAAGRV